MENTTLMQVDYNLASLRFTIDNLLDEGKIGGHDLEAAELQWKSLRLFRTLLIKEKKGVLFQKRLNRYNALIQDVIDLYEHYGLVDEGFKK